MGVEPAKIVNDAVPSAGAAAVCAPAAAAVSRSAPIADVNWRERMVSGYQEALERAAFDERIDRGRVAVAGAGAQAFLQALVTNDIAPMEPGTARYAALLTPQGRMITDMQIVMRAPEAFMLVVPSDAAGPLAARLDKLIFAEAVEVEDASGTTAHFSIAGPEASRVADLVPVSPLARWSNDELGLQGVDVIVPASEAERARAALVSAAAPLSREAREILRVEAGRPEFHVDMTGETIPLEANLLDRAISTTKGCYPGQEVIIRVLHRGGGRVAKRLVRLRFDASETDVPARESALSIGGTQVGRVTSAVWSPRLGAAIGLGYVHRDQAGEGQTLSLPDGRGATIISA